MLGFLLVSSALALPGLRTDGVVPGPGRAEGGVIGGLSAEMDSGAKTYAMGLGGLFGVGQDLGVGVTGVWDGRTLISAEGRLYTPLFGTRQDPRLVFVGGLDAIGSTTDIAEVPVWWVEAGLMAGRGITDTVRFYTGIMGDWEPADGLDGFWVSPSVGVGWRPVLSKKLSGRLDVEMQGGTDFDRIWGGPVVLIGVGAK